MLSVFITPWMKPTSCQRAMSAACRSAIASNSERSAAHPPPRPGRAARWCSPRARQRAGSRWAAAHSNVPTRRWLAATRVSTAPGSTRSRCTGSPVETTARLRDVGMPSACIASLMTSSRSIGPSAARPSPRREYGVCPAPFELHVHARAVGRDLLAEQDGAAITEAREVAELVPGIRLGERDGAAPSQGLVVPSRGVCLWPSL
jgi:hypothetical protein